MSRELAEIRKEINRLQENENNSDTEEQNQGGSSSENTEENQSEEQNQEEKTGSAAKENEGDEKYDEEMQAKARRYREIPEDPGGLLKALIYQEYRQNRYNEQ